MQRKKFAQRRAVRNRNIFNYLHNARQVADRQQFAQVSPGAVYTPKTGCKRDLPLEVPGSMRAYQEERGIIE